MKIEEITSLISGAVVEGSDTQIDEVDCAFASDLMSDVLTLRTDKQVMLITGLCNTQTIRTCEMSDIKVIMFARGKKVTEEMKDWRKMTKCCSSRPRFRSTRLQAFCTVQASPASIKSFFYAF